mmetsp:Transcript_36538/g.66963  ORF Transcript_36538/g.66963 Transcript_36538/m.66963 type:complete len:187 (-) Transcript_36538:159-719(-)
MSNTSHPAHGCWDLRRLRVGGRKDYDLSAAKGSRQKELSHAVTGIVKDGPGASLRRVHHACSSQDRRDFLVMQLTQSDEQSFRLSFPLGNTLMTTVRLGGGAEGEELLQVGRVASTMKTASPDLMALERILSEALPAVSSWTIDSAGTNVAELHMRGHDVELDFVYYDPEKLKGKLPKMGFFGKKN